MISLTLCLFSLLALLGIIAWILSFRQIMKGNPGSTLALAGAIAGPVAISPFVLLIFAQMGWPIWLALVVIGSLLISSLWLFIKLTRKPV